MMLLPSLRHSFHCRTHTHAHTHTQENTHVIRLICTCLNTKSTNLYSHKRSRLEYNITMWFKCRQSLSVSWYLGSCYVLLPLNYFLLWLSSQFIDEDNAIFSSICVHYSQPRQHESDLKLKLYHIWELTDVCAVFRSSATRFRWIQNYYGEQDEWALDDIYIGQQCPNMCHGHGWCDHGHCRCATTYRYIQITFLLHNKAYIGHKWKWTHSTSDYKSILPW